MPARATTLHAAGTIYYVSASGDDANSGTQAQPWRSLARVQTALNSNALAAGDQILFARGAVFTGALTLDENDSGTSGAPLTLGAYGSGAKPVLSGLHTLSNWQSLGNNQWKAICSACTAVVPALLTINGTPQGIARWPNLNEADEGYRYITSASGNNSITDSSLSANPNWAGGELVVRSIAWVLDRLTIVTHTGGTLTTATNANYALEPGWGYFIQNHLAALDRDGEWVYNSAEKSITLQWPSNPSTELVEVPVGNTLVEISGSQHIAFQNLELRGAQTDLVRFNDCSHLTLENLDLRLVGDNAINGYACPNLQLSNSAVTDSMNNGLNIDTCANCQISNVTVERIGLLAGMGGNGDGQYVGVRVTGTAGNPAVFEYSTVSGIGYLAVNVAGNVTARYNLVEDWNRVKMDGAGIYSWGVQNVRLEQNIVRNAYGSTAGTPWDNTGTHGIYIDDNSEFVIVKGNAVANVSGSGLYLHNTRSVTVTENLFFNPDETGIQLIDDNLGSYSLENSLITSNTVVAQNVPVMLVESTQTNALFSTLGTINHNRYCDPFGPEQFHVQLPSTGQAAKSFARWKAGHGRDVNSSICAEQYASHLVTGPPGPNRVSNGTFDSNLNGWFGWPGDTLDAQWETGRLDGGSLRLGYNGPAPTIHYDYPIGAVQSGQTYRLQLSGVTVAGAPALTAYLRQGGMPYNRVSNTQPVWVENSRAELELFLEVNATEADTFLIFELNSPGTTVGLDNITLQAVTATTQSTATITRFESNATNTPKSITLSGYNYRGVDGTLYLAGTQVALQPYEAKVFFRGEAANPHFVFLPCIRR